MDLLPAANFVTQMTYGTLGTEDLAKRQRQEVEKRMDMNNYSKYSSSLGESQIFFLRQQSEFTHCVRLIVHCIVVSIPFPILDLVGAFGKILVQNYFHWREIYLWNQDHD